MKVIDLLVDIANSKEVPKNIKYDDYILTYDEYTQDYYNEPSCTYSLLDNIHYKLNDKVEIIEDTPKEDKKIEDLYIDKEFLLNVDDTNKKINEIINKHNMLVDKVNGE